MDSLCLYSQNLLGFHLGRKGHGNWMVRGTWVRANPAMTWYLCYDIICVLRVCYCGKLHIMLALPQLLAANWKKRPRRHKRDRLAGISEDSSGKCGVLEKRSGKSNVDCSNLKRVLHMNRKLYSRVPLKGQGSKMGIVLITPQRRVKRLVFGVCLLSWCFMLHHLFLCWFILVGISAQVLNTRLGRVKLMLLLVCSLSLMFDSPLLFT